MKILICDGCGKEVSLIETYDFGDLCPRCEILFKEFYGKFYKEKEELCKKLFEETFPKIKYVKLNFKN